MAKIKYKRRISHRLAYHIVQSLKLEDMGYLRGEDWEVVSDQVDLFTGGDLTCDRLACLTDWVFDCLETLSECERRL